MPEFQLNSTPLPAGKMLIEASAGTGKTYSLIGIILRLLIEEGIPLQEILVVTFTDAATAELKERVRTGLVSLRNALQSDEKPKDAFQCHLWERLRDDAAKRKECEDRLKDALEVFDRASISTIHGFCSAALTENAFESGSLFDTEVLTDEKELIKEAVNDFWRKFVSAPENQHNALALKYGGTLTGMPEGINKVEGLIDHLKKTINSTSDRQTDNLLSDEDLSERLQKLESLVDSYGGELEKLRLSFAKEKEALKKIFDLEGGILDGRAYPGDALKELHHLIDTAQDCSKDEFTALISSNSRRFFRITLNKINNRRGGILAAQRSKVDLTLETFSTAQDIHDKLVEFQNIFMELFDSIGPELLAIKKASQNLITFDDMIVKMRDAVESSEPLVLSLRDRYKVALIDEFQDTDEKQLAIFQTIFSTKEHRLYCVGDPKQSIYKFRGGDLDTYLSVYQDNKDFKKYSLTTNYRSDKEMIEAVNAIFSYRHNDHFGEEIPFKPAQHPDGEKETEAGADKEIQTVFVLRYLGEQAFPSQVAEAEVRETLSFKQKHPETIENPFSYSKVAVLVNSHAQARAIANAYQAAGIPSIRKIDNSVYSSETAIILRIALNGILECGRIKPLKAALATPLFGRTNQEIVQLEENDARLNKEMDTLHEYRRLWQEQGFMAAFQRVLAQEEVRQRLLKQPGGDESLSLYLHLAELLHAHAQRHHPSPEALLQYLVDCIQDQPLSEATKFRRSTDMEAVTISTVHSAKGLEYEYVIVPFAWSKPKNEDASDLEAMRKLYVALTRAKKRCTLFITRNRDTYKTALGKILALENADQDIETASTSLAESSEFLIFKGSDSSDPEKTQDSDVPESKGIDLLPEVPVASKPPPCRIITSFSGLNKSGKGQTTHEADVEDPGVPQGDDAIESDFQTRSASGYKADPMPRGAPIGRAVHAIFENIDFQDSKDITSEIGPQLKREGFKNPEVAKYLEERFPNWLSTPLQTSGGFGLNEIPTCQRINELEFHFPQKGINGEKLAGAITPEKWDQLTKKVASIDCNLSGFLKGYIDLTFECEGKFYIADWKSNYLGENLQDYNQDTIRDSMLDHLYPLQYLIYTVALDAYLKARIDQYDYGTHFGGVFYVYLRGFGHDAGHSVYFSKPAAETIHNLRTLFGLEATQ